MLMLSWLVSVHPSLKNIGLNSDQVTNFRQPSAIDG